MLLKVVYANKQKISVNSMSTDSNTYLHCVFLKCGRRKNRSFFATFFDRTKKVGETHRYTRFVSASIGVSYIKSISERNESRGSERDSFCVVSCSSTSSTSSNKSF